MKTKKTALTSLIILSFFYSNILFCQLKVLSTGKVGIGTLTPVAKLHVTGDAAIFTSTAGWPTTCAFIRCNNGNSTATTPDYTWFGNDQVGFFHPAINEIGVTTQGTERMRISTNCVYFTNTALAINSAPYIRTTNSWSTATTPDYTWFGNDQTGLFHPAANVIAFSIAGTERVRLDASGRLGIGLTPTYQLQLSTNSAAKPGSSSWTIASDIRLKTNVRKYEAGLSDLIKIQPIWFTYNGEVGLPTNESYVGVSAQELQKVAPYMVSEFTYSASNNKESRQEGKKYLAVDNGAMTYMLINSVKELNKKITDLEAQLSYCCTKKQEVNADIKSDPTNNMARLLQNNPNPFTQQTTIGYYLPKETKSASIMIFDMQGKLVKTIAITTFESASLTINANELSAGMFMYSLVADGKEVDSKRMILTQ